MARIAGTKNKRNPPESIEAARKMARIKALDAAPLWGLEAKHLSHICCRGEVPEAKKFGRVWFVTPGGMDRMFEQKRKR